MKIKNFIVLFILTLFVYCDASFVDNLPKCSINDNECLRVLYQSVITDIGKTGAPEINIPPVDPIELKNITVTVLDLVDITLVEGVAKGIKDCVFDKFMINITTESGYQENRCDVTIKGHYKVTPKSPLVETILGGNQLRADGNAKIKIEKLQLNFNFPFYAQKRDDGEIYIKCIYDQIKYTYKIGKLVLFADNLFLGEQDASKLLTEMINENWRLVLSTFGQPFIDKAMEFYFKYAGNFFENVPTRHYILEDLTPYSKP